MKRLFWGKAYRLTGYGIFLYFCSFDNNLAHIFLTFFDFKCFWGWWGRRLLIVRCRLMRLH
ncbi:MAG: hypothetical protein LBJ00_10515 [Planctomycetaceae bacterium]|nr:hypothetical protein [Planctomycetaceae bacterium]